MLSDVVLVGLDGKTKLWPMKSPGSFAAEFSAGMVVPHPGSHWSDPDVLAQRRAEAAKETARMADWMAQATKDQEDLANQRQREIAAAMRARAG
jgi:hypothetical protein